MKYEYQTALNYRFRPSTPGRGLRCDSHVHPRRLRKVNNHLIALHHVYNSIKANWMETAHRTEWGKRANLFLVSDRKGKSRKVKQVAVVMQQS